MSGEETVFGECHRCGEDATLSVCHPDGVFRDVCKECFRRSLERGVLEAIADKLKDWRLLLVGGLLVLMSGVAMQFQPVEQAVPLPAISYLVLGGVGIGVAIWRFRSSLRANREVDDG